LLRTGTVSQSDFLGSQVYSLADGSKLKGTRFIIRELKVGNHVAANVIGSVGPVTGDLLLGLSFLSRFGAVTLDNERHVLILSKVTEQLRDQQQSNQQTAATIPGRPDNAVRGRGEDRVPPPITDSDLARFRLTNCRSVLDHRTHLEWYVGPDVNMNWDSANKWAQGLTECAATWVMPTVDQLRGLFDPNNTAGTGYYTRGRYWPAHLNPIFSQIGRGSWVWARGTPDAEGAPAFNFNQGIPVRISLINSEFTVRSFAVRRSSGE
jgi:hypothetical protein